MTGIMGWRSFSLELAMEFVSTSHLAPSMKSPCMQAPSFTGWVISSLVFLVTSHVRHILSSGSSFFLAVLCMIAVRKDCGLKKPGSQTE